MASSMFLFWGSGSIPCWKAMLALEEKGFKGYPNKLVSFSNKEHKSDEIMKLNPRGQVPTFKYGDIVINESHAICEYLESRHADQGTQLIPSDPKEKASVFQRMFEISNIDQAVIKDLVVYAMFTKKEDQTEEILKGKMDKARTEIKIWEGYMKNNGSGAHIASKNFSMADVLFFPYLAFSVRSGLNMDKFPALAEYYKRVKDRASVQSTWPPHWKTDPSKLDVFKAI